MDLYFLYDRTHNYADFFENDPKTETKKLQMKKSITQRSYEGMKEFVLNDVNIGTIEYLHRLNFPNLTFLSIDRNPICSIKDLRKNNWINLTAINIGTTSP